MAIKGKLKTTLLLLLGNMTSLFKNSQQSMARIVYSQKEKPMLRHHGFHYHFLINRDRSKRYVRTGTSAMLNIQLVRIWITLQSFKKGQENNSIMLTLKGKQEKP